MTRPEINALLEKHGIPLDTWGKGEAKTLERHLYREIETGESTLVEQGGKLVRLITGVSVRLYYPEGAGVVTLKEDRQVFSDGRVRRRDVVGVGEKMKPGEDPMVAARRAMSEELLIAEEFPLFDMGIEERGPLVSNSFPGLLTHYKTYRFQGRMPDHLYRDEYVEVQEDKTNYYTWVPGPPGISIQMI